MFAFRFYTITIKQFDDTRWSGRLETRQTYRETAYIDRLKTIDILMIINCLNHPFLIYMLRQWQLDDEAIDRVREKGAYLRQSIEDMNLPCLGATRGKGLMIGIAVAEGYSNKELCAKLNKAGLLCITAGPCLRLLPPLTITREEMDKGLVILKETLK